MLYDPVVDVTTRAYCGPTAISSITQAPISKIRKMVRRMRKAFAKTYEGHNYYGAWADKQLSGRKHPVRGMYHNEMLDVMRRLKRYPTEHKKFKGTLRAFMDDYGHSGPFIVVVTGHYVAISKGMICDTYTKKPVPFAEYPKPGWRVKEYFKFT